jgi:hypothetical protein
VRPWTPSPASKKEKGWEGEREREREGETEKERERRKGGKEEKKEGQKEGRKEENKFKSSGLHSYFPQGHSNLHEENILSMQINIVRRI